MFWLACEDLKKENNPEKIEEKARMIYEDYVSILSPSRFSTLFEELMKGCNQVRNREKFHHVDHKLGVFN